MQRARTALAQAVVVAAGGFASAADANNKEAWFKEGSIIHILLVHGSFHDESCWGLFTPVLAAKGFSVHALTLSGHGASRVSPFRVSMATYARDVCAKVASSGHPCAVLGHSMGGMVITSAAEARPDLFSHLIYLAAIASPMQRSSLMTAKDATRIAAGIKPYLLRGVAVIDREFARTAFYNTCPSDIAEQAPQRLCPQPLPHRFPALSGAPNASAPSRSHTSSARKIGPFRSRSSARCKTT